MVVSKILNWKLQAIILDEAVFTFINATNSNIPFG